MIIVNMHVLNVPKTTYEIKIVSMKARNEAHIELYILSEHEQF
jgi:hypothetical protein